MGVVLGLDGGGTKTLIALADRAGRVTRYVAGPGLDPMGAGDWEDVLAMMVSGLGAVEAAVLGLPYFSEVPEISARQQAVAQRLLGPDARVRNDVDVAFEGAMGGQEGVLILAGTGSMAWARGPLGTVRAGGYGDAFGDEGSAHWIGRLALNLVSRHLDGRRRSGGFARGILAALGIAGDDLIAWTYGRVRAGRGGAGHGLARADIAAVARHVAALAADGNAEATLLLKRAARELAALGRAAGRAAGLDEMRWSYAGGVLGNLTLRDMVAEALGVGPVAARLPPVGGAVLAAARAAGWDVGSEFVGQLARSLREAAENPESA